MSEVNQVRVEHLRKARDRMNGVIHSLNEAKNNHDSLLISMSQRVMNADSSKEVQKLLALLSNLNHLGDALRMLTIEQIFYISTPSGIFPGVSISELKPNNSYQQTQQQNVPQPQMAQQPQVNAPQSQMAQQPQVNAPQSQMAQQPQVKVGIEEILSIFEPKNVRTNGVKKDQLVAIIHEVRGEGRKPFLHCWPEITQRFAGLGLDLPGVLAVFQQNPNVSEFQEALTEFNTLKEEEMMSILPLLMGMGGKSSKKPSNIEDAEFGNISKVES